jgi:hypothetical protein
MASMKNAALTKNNDISDGIAYIGTVTMIRTTVLKRYYFFHAAQAIPNESRRWRSMDAVERSTGPTLSLRQKWGVAECRSDFW